MSASGGAPQGGVLSPCLSNIYLDRFDKFVETVLLPGYTRGVLRSSNPEYNRVSSALHRARKRGDHAAVRVLRKQQRSLPTGDPCDPGYRRLRYVRYADDILLGFAGPKAEAEEIKRRLAQFLQEDLKLELSETKTLITHARTAQPARSPLNPGICRYPRVCTPQQAASTPNNPVLRGTSQSF